MRTPLVIGALILYAGVSTAPAQQIDLRVPDLSQNVDGKYEVQAGATVNWQIWATVPEDGDPETGGLAGISVDLASNLRTAEPSFSLSPASSLALPENFDNQMSLGVVIDSNGLSVIHTIGGAQDTPDNLPAMIEVMIDGQPTLVDNPQGIVVPGIGEGEPVLVAEGSFVVPAGLAAGTEFTLLTGGVPDNPGQTKMASLGFFGAGPDPNDPDNPCGTGNSNDCGGDFQWTAILHDITTTPPLEQTHGPDSPLQLLVVEDGDECPELVQVAGSSVDTPDTFISPKAENVPFTQYQIELTQPSVLTGHEVVFTGSAGDAPSVTGLSDDGGGLHTVTLDQALEPGQWAKITLNVESAATGCAASIVTFVAHQPNNINQDDITNIQDATAFGNEFRGDKRLLLVDLNDDGIVNVQDATIFGNMWFGRDPATQAWRNVSLPAKPG